MPNPKTFTGGCHCGQVRFEATSDLAMVTACNCSYLHQEGPAFRVSGAEELSAPRRRGKLAGNICSTSTPSGISSASIAGVDVFARGNRPDGTEVVALNVSCIDGVDLSKIAMTSIDGRNR